MMQGLITDSWKIARPYWQSPERWLARGLLALIIVLNLGEVYINVLLNKWNNDFYNSLQAVDKTAFVHALIKFSYLATAFIIVVVYKIYVNQILSIRWRRWMTTDYLQSWLRLQNYYRMQLFGVPADNPDQRISDDIDQFISLALSLSLGLLSAVVTLFSFLTILWNLSGPLEFHIAGRLIVIPGYMVWVALVYALLGTLITARLGRPLIALNYAQQRYEADFRFSLIRLRENSESIAFYKGEPVEYQTFTTRFGAIVGNVWQIMKRQKLLNWFTSGYQQIATIFPFVVAAPRYFAGQIQLGALMQTASAFGQVQGSLSYIIDAYTSIATWKAVTERLTGFNQSIVRAEDARLLSDKIVQTLPGNDAIIANDLTIYLPSQAVLLSGLTMTIAPGASLLITGPSGSGKSTLLRTLAGIWPFVSGTLSLPEARRLFVPQKPYLPLGSLRQILCYPDIAAPDDETLRALLSLCKLDHLAARLDEISLWSHTLSLGEQQRIAFVRIFLTAPDFVFLDEATSALDEPAEAYFYALLKSRLPAAAIVSVGHRATLRMWHDREEKLG